MLARGGRESVRRCDPTLVVEDLHRRLSIVYDGIDRHRAMALRAHQDVEGVGALHQRGPVEEMGARGIVGGFGVDDGAGRSIITVPTERSSWMSRLRLAVMGAAVACAGCGGGPTTIEVTVAQGAGPKIVSLSATATLDHHDGGVPQPLPQNGGALELPGTIVITVPGDAAVPVTVTLDAVDADGNRFATSQTVQSSPHERVPLQFVLGALVDGGGRSFAVEASGTAGDLVGLWGQAGAVLAVGPDVAIARTAGDGGFAWSEVVGLRGNGSTGVTGNANIIVVASGQNSVTVSSDDGASWIPHTLPIVGRAVWFNPGDLFYAAGAAGGIASCSDGASFADENAPAGSDLAGGWGGGGPALFAVGAAGTIMRRVPVTDGGASWAVVPSGSASDLAAVWGASSNELFIVGSGGTILHTTDGAQSFHAQALPGAPALHGVWGAGGDDVYVVGDSGLVAWSGDHGATWTPLSVPTTRNLRAVWGASAADVFIVGDGGTVLHGGASGF
jgi:hypothetical protein